MGVLITAKHVTERIYKSVFHVILDIIWLSIKVVLNVMIQTAITVKFLRKFVLNVIKGMHLIKGHANFVKIKVVQFAVILVNVWNVHQVTLWWLMVHVNNVEVIAGHATPLQFISASQNATQLHICQTTHVFRVHLNANHVSLHRSVPLASIDTI